MSGAINFIGKAANVVFLGVPGAILNYLTPNPPKQTIALGEISKQTAKEAEPRAIVWGRFRPIGGNIIHVQAPQTQWITTTQKVSSGKGGKKKKKQVTKTQHVYRTYAIGVCEGPISKFIRIWRNGKLVYDARGTAWGTNNNQVFLNQARLYTGSWTQTADSTLQAIWGAANVPAYRGTAYIVVINEDLTDLGGAVPQYQFEVERAEGLFLTSRPYVVESLEAMQATGVTGFKEAPNAIVTEAMETDGIIDITGSLEVKLVEYAVPAEAFDTSLDDVTGTLRNLFLSYDIPAEAMDANGISSVTGTLNQTLITYANYPAEAFDTGIDSVTGSMTIP